MTDTTSPVETDPVATEEHLPHAPDPNSQDDDECARKADEAKEETKKRTRKPRPFAIEKWNKGLGREGCFEPMEVSEENGIDTTSKAVSFVQRNCGQGRYRVIQICDVFTLKSEKVTKTTIDRG